MIEERSLSNIPMEDLLNRVGSLYKLVILASRRAIELNSGVEKLVDMSLNIKPSIVALQEIREGKVTYKKSEGK